MNKFLTYILNDPHPLSDSQKEAVVAEARYVRLIAGAGAGKTETLTRRILYLLFEKHFSPGSIVAFTFTEKAAASMKNRIFKRVLGLGAVEIYNTLGDMYIGTIHGFCNRVLEEKFGYGSWEVLDENQEMALLINICDRIGLTTGRNTTDRVSIFKQSLSVMYNDLLSRDDIERQAPEFFASVRAYEAYLDRFHLLTFDRMITLALTHLQANPDASRSIRHLIVDEYQVINPTQEALIKTIGRNDIFVVGDPRQTIFQWRGSDEGCFQRFASFYPDVYDIVLPENRRSGRQIVTVANTLASHFRTGPYEPMTATRPDAGAVYRIDYPTSGDEAEGVAEQILSLVNSSSCRYQDIGILLRSVNNSATPFIQALRRYHIPFILSGQVGLFKRQEILSLAKIFCWLSPKGFFPASVKDRKNTISGDLLLDSAIDDWFSVMTPVYTKEVVRKTLGYWKLTVLENKAYRNFTTAYYNLLSILGFHALSPDNAEDAVVMGNIASFGRVLADFESSQHYGGKTGDIVTFVRDLHWYLFLYAYWRYEESAGEQDTAIDAVRLSTVHQAKGLEWPVVFVPALLDGKFPSSRVGERKNWLIPHELFSALRYEGNTEAERQLFYVAITRARDLVCLSWYEEEGDSGMEPSQFIEDEIGREPVIPHPYIRSVPGLSCQAPEPDDELHSFSARDLILFQQCPYRYRLNKEWGFLPGLSPDLGFGNALHFCLGEISNLLKQGVPVEQAVEQSIESGFFLPYADRSRFLGMKRVAHQRLLSYATKRKEDLLRVHASEYRIEFPVRNGTIIGKIDVMLDAPGGLEIQDYKTSDEVIAPEAGAMQVKIYAYGLRLLGKSVSSGGVAYIEDARVDPVPVQTHEIDGVREIVEGLIDQIQEKKFQGKPGKQCGGCDYFQICRFR